MTVLVEVVHAVKPLTNTVFDKWVDWYGTDVIPAMDRNGFDVLGAFKRSTGPMGEDVLVVRFDSTADYERAGISLRKDAAFLKSLASVAGAWVVSESVKVANIVPYATEQRLEKQLGARPEKPRQYLQAVLRMKYGGQPATMAALDKLVDIVDSSGRMALVTAYETSIGQRGELTDLWVSGDGVPDLSYRPGDPMAELVAALREGAPEESISYLNPLPYSKLR